MANQNIARLGVVLALDSGELATGVAEAQAKFKSLTTEIKRSSEQAAKDILALKYATEAYGKTLTAVEKVELEMRYGKYAGITMEEKYKKQLLEQAAAYDAVAVAATKANAAKTGKPGLTAQQSAALGYQTTDIVTSLAGGQNPFMVLLQQGGQLKDQFGGFKPLFAGIAQALTATRVAAVGLGGAFATLGYAMYLGNQEEKAFNNSLILTGGYLNMTEKQFTDLSKTISAKYHTSLSDTREAMQAVVSSGQFTTVAFGSVAEAIARVSKLSGESVDMVAKGLIPALDGTAASAKRLNDQYHFLTVELYQQIRQHEANGDLQKSIALTADALTAKLNKQKKELEGLAGAWATLTEAFGKFWQGMKDIGKMPDMVEAAASALQIAAERASNVNSTLLDKKKLEQAQATYIAEVQKATEKRQQSEEEAKKAVEEKAKVDAIASGEVLKRQTLAFETAKLYRDMDFNQRVKIGDKIQNIEVERARDVANARAEIEKKNIDELGKYATENAAYLKAKIADINAKAAKDIRAERRTQDIEDTRIAADTAKRNADVEFNTKLIALDAAGKIELKRKRDLADAVSETQRANEAGNFQHEMQLAINLAARKAEINAKAKADTDEIYAKAREQYRVTLDAEQATLDREQEKIRFYRENILLSGADLEIALSRLKTEQAITEIMAKRDGGSLEDKLAAADRMRGMQIQREAIISQQDELKKLQDINGAVFNNMSNALQTFVNTGKLSFGDLAGSIIRDLMMIELKAQATSIWKSIGGMPGLMSMAGFGGASAGLDIGVMGMPGIPGLATGGSVTAGTTYMVGENGPELFTSASSGTIVPNGQMGAAMAGNTINYNGPYINTMSAIDTQSGLQFLAKNKEGVWAANQSASRSIPMSR